MQNLLDKLPNLSSVMLKNLESSIVSLYRINKEHRLFLPILQQNPELEAAEYIIYPNINGNTNKIFLEKDGSEILSYKDGVSEFILLPCEFDTNQSSIPIDNPYANNMGTFRGMFY